ncbi:hypothetical protein CULT_1990003 [[Clostridium] ultunense Esp]|nr:hypothetical protein CULT_1990003 [[Clostridium] ultunense Esp]
MLAGYQPKNLIGSVLKSGFERTFGRGSVQPVDGEAWRQT